MNGIGLMKKPFRALNLIESYVSRVKYEHASLSLQRCLLGAPSSDEHNYWVSKWRWILVSEDARPDIELMHAKTSLLCHNQQSYGIFPESEILYSP